MNQSALDSRIVSGMKYSSTWFGDSSSQILFNDSTAYAHVLASCNVSQKITHLVTDKRLFDRSKILKR